MFAINTAILDIIVSSDYLLNTNIIYGVFSLFDPGVGKPGLVGPR